MIKFEVGKFYYFNGHMTTMFGECIERDTSDSRWWAK